jgi:hypothetical protein
MNFQLKHKQRNNVFVGQGEARSKALCGGLSKAKNQTHVWDEVTCTNCMRSKPECFRKGIAFTKTFRTL